MSEVQYYVLFPNHENAMKLYRELKNHGVGAVIAPTPRSLSRCCGVALMISREDVSRIEKTAEKKGIDILGIASIEKDENPKRDKYC